VERLGKRVAAVAGDTVETDAEGVHVNHFLIPGSRSLTSDSRGRALPQKWGWIVIRPGELFLVATDNRRSFDSRYFGAVAATDLIVVEPVLVPH
jgi:type IV secretory pathway protease TraF